MCQKARTVQTKRFQSFAVLPNPNHGKTAKGQCGPSFLVSLDKMLCMHFSELHYKLHACDSRFCLLQDFILEHYSEDGEKYESCIEDFLNLRRVSSKYTNCKRMKHISIGFSFFVKVYFSNSEMHRPISQHKKLVCYGRVRNF